jgi:hypothetical protein
VLNNDPIIIKPIGIPVIKKSNYCKYIMTENIHQFEFNDEVITYLYKPKDFENQIFIPLVKYTYIPSGGQISKLRTFEHSSKILKFIEELNLMINSNQELTHMYYRRRVMGICGWFLLTFSIVSAIGLFIAGIHDAEVIKDQNSKETNYKQSTSAPFFIIFTFLIIFGVYMFWICNYSTLLRFYEIQKYKNNLYKAHIHELISNFNGDYLTGTNIYVSMPANLEYLHINTNARKALIVEPIIYNSILN